MTLERESPSTAALMLTLFNLPLMARHSLPNQLIGTISGMNIPPRSDILAPALIRRIYALLLS